VGVAEHLVHGLVETFFFVRFGFLFFFGFVPAARSARPFSPGPGQLANCSRAQAP